ncbi:MAG TPA: haloacid dehalogenase [Micromonosporaceae bacterium]|nr:haloacid dehalogenase [Micromonosporaceae bacterium]
MRRRRPRALLIDFDGVLRQYDRAIQVEPRYGLEPGAFLAAGLEWTRYLPAVTGEWTRAKWLASIAEATGAPAAALSEWDEYRGYVDESVLAFVREVRASGTPVALVTNATDDLRDDLARFNLAEEFDAIVSSAEIGWHKPSRDFFEAACKVVGLQAEECLLVDDTARNVSGARAAGLSAMRWTGLDDLRYLRTALLSS